MSEQPGVQPRPQPLHPHLTVALAGPAERAGLVVALGGTTVDAAAVEARAADLAAERSADRAAHRASLEAAARRAGLDVDAATDRYQRIVAGQEALLEAAAWASERSAQLPELRRAVDDARRTVDRREAEQRAAAAALERVLEQRAAANAAMEEAGRELSELAGVEMDETGLRRELEASGRAVSTAEEAHAQAQRALAELLSRRADLDEREAALARAVGSADGPVADPALIEAVDAALGPWRRAAAAGRSHPEAQQLADAWCDLQADLAEVAADQAPLPDRAEVAAAEERLRRATALVAELEAASPTGALSPEEMAEVDAAHAAVLDAEERTGRRIGAGNARKRLEEARSVEEALLARLGFASHLDVVLSGGRRTSKDPGRLLAEHELGEASMALEALKRASVASPDLAYLDGERTRLRSHVVDLLGADPGPDPVPLLRRHPDVPREAVAELRRALDAVGVDPSGSSLDAAAAGWLEAQRATLAEQAEFQRARDRAEAERAAIVQEREALQVALDAAERDEARAAEELELAGRSVGAFEAELTMRADAGVTRMKRFAAAEQLRNQIEALALTLVRAEEEARTALDAAMDLTVRAEGDLDRAADTLAATVRRSRDLVAELPADRRPEGDPLDVLDELAQALTAHAESFATDLDSARAELDGRTEQHDAAVAAAGAAPTGAEGPQPEDRRDALRRLLAEAAGAVLVLDDPTEALAQAAPNELLELVAQSSARVPMVLLTADPEIVGLAIELPAEVATVVPADYLLNSVVPGADDEAGATPSVVELGDGPEIEHPTPPVPRWAGRR